jgi:signal transduction histidine kinase
VQLQLLRTDVPSAGAQIAETLKILEDVLDCVRDLTRELCPSPAYTGGLKQALFRLSDRHASDNCHIEVEYGATEPVPAEIAVSLYEAGSGALELALDHGAKTVNIRVRGANPLVLRIADDGRKAGRTRALAIIGTLARQQGLAFECSTGKGTIVSIRYAIRRSARG